MEDNRETLELQLVQDNDLFNLWKKMSDTPNLNGALGRRAFSEAAYTVLFDLVCGLEEAGVIEKGYFKERTSKLASRVFIVLQNRENKGKHE